MLLGSLKLGWAFRIISFGLGLFPAVLVSCQLAVHHLWKEAWSWVRSSLQPTQSSKDWLLRCFGSISAPGRGVLCSLRGIWTAHLRVHCSLPVPVTGPNTVSGVSCSTFTNALWDRHCQCCHFMNEKVRHQEIKEFTLNLRPVELVLKPSLTVIYCLRWFWRYKLSTFS